VTAARLLGIGLLAAVYLLVLGSAHPLDLALGLLLATAVSSWLHGRLLAPRGTGAPSLPARIAAFPLLAVAVLAEIARGTWDVALRVLHLRKLERPGIVAIPIGERSPLGVAVTGLLVGLSPGSTLLEVDERRRTMLFHVIDASDADGVRASIDRLYQRYQRRVFP
jgi:multisubunit Na+/H+ antiporter MnhE subunit